MTELVEQQEMVDNRSQVVRIRKIHVPSMSQNSCVVAMFRGRSCSKGWYVACTHMVVRVFGMRLVS